MRRSPGAERRLWFLLFVLSALLMLAIAGAACGDDDDDDDSSSSIDDDTGDDDITDDDDDDDTDDDDTSDDDTADDDTGDDDTAEAPFFPVGGPFADADENAGEWVWLPVPGNICRDGSATGIAVRLQENANKLMIFMQGGGACFDAGTCAGNPKKFGESEFTSAKSGELTKGVFADGGAAAAETSALSGWHNVFVPYCTGDVHSGNATDVEIKGASGKQQFVGLINIRNIADLLGEYFDGVQTVFLIGQSAGGFGTNLGFLEFAQAFPGNDVNVFNDSAPLPADNDVLSPVLQFGLRSLWNVVPPPGCDDCGTKFDGLENIQKYNATEYPNSTFGLYSYLEDETIRDFFQVGDPITGEAYAAGLEDLRDNLLEPTGRWSTFFIEGTGHAPSTSDTYFEIEEGGTSLQEWVEELATASDPPASVAP